jgi:putative flippase GtrA
MLAQVSRYIAVQAVAYVLDMGGFILLGAAGLGVVTANILAKLAAGSFAFVAHRHFTFGVDRRYDARGQLVKYAVLLAANVPLSSGLLVLLMRWVVSPVLAKLLADLLCVAITFLLSRHVVFRAIGEVRR